MYLLDVASEIRVEKLTREGSFRKLPSLGLLLPSAHQPLPATFRKQAHFSHPLPHTLLRCLTYMLAYVFKAKEYTSSTYV